MKCHTCKHALMRSATPNRPWNYEACSVGIIPMTPQLPTEHHDCRMWESGNAKEPSGITLIYGTDIDL